MAPEQARGKLVDRRADIWAFGCVLFEMLAGQRPFDGSDATDAIVAVLSKEPDWDRLPSAARRVHPLLARCLQKDTRKRLQAIGDARIHIDELIGGSSDPAWPSPTHDGHRRWPVAAAIAATALSTAAITWALVRASPPNPRLPARFEIIPPPSQALQILGPDRNIALSPDGRYLTYRQGLPQSWWCARSTASSRSGWVRLPARAAPSFLRMVAGSASSMALR